MVQLRKVRARQRIGLEEFASRLEMSRSTLARIEAAERKGEKYPASFDMIERLIEKLEDLLKCGVSLEDLEGITLAPPRPGRPKKEQRSNTNA